MLQVKIECLKSWLSKAAPLTQKEWDFHREHNIPYNSYFIDKGADEDERKRAAFQHTDEELTTIVEEDFLHQLAPYVCDDLTHLTIFRALELVDINELDTSNIGEYWSFTIDNAKPYNDCEYKRDESLERDKYLIRARIPLSEINFHQTFDLYALNEFMESEITPSENFKPNTIEFKKFGDNNYKTLNIGQCS